MEKFLEVKPEVKPIDKPEAYSMLLQKTRRRKR